MCIGGPRAVAPWLTTASIALLAMTMKYEKARDLGKFFFFSLSYTAMTLTWITQEIIRRTNLLLPWHLWRNISIMS